MRVSEQPLLSTGEAARRLGVKRETVYAYVSRGLLQRHPSSAHRATRFDADAVERLAGRARRNDRSGALEVVIETQLTAIDPAGRVHYRGHDVVELARFRSFEDVAGLLWDGEAYAPWTLDPPGRGLVASLRSSVLARTPVQAADLIPIAVAALAPSDAGRGDRRPDAVRRAGARICAGALEILDPGPDRRGPAAERLWRALAADRPGSLAREQPGLPGQTRRAQVAAIDAALVLLADHELAASTLAARVAASAWADPYRAVLAGLGPLGGVLHGASPAIVQSMLAEIRVPEAAFAALEARLAAAGAVPGFGHRVYRDRDPRADHLLGRVGAVAADQTAVATVTNVLDAAVALGLPAPNVDFGLSALAYAMELEIGAAATIFTVARIAGLIAHTIEEYPHRLRFRPRATYMGPAPRIA
jgi:citrate synthase